MDCRAGYCRREGHVDVGAGAAGTPAGDAYGGGDAGVEGEGAGGEEASSGSGLVDWDGKELGGWRGWEMRGLEDLRSSYDFGGVGTVVGSGREEGRCRG